MQFIIRVGAEEFESIRTKYNNGEPIDATQYERFQTLLEFWKNDALIVEPSRKFIEDRKAFRDKHGFEPYNPKDNESDAILSLVAMMQMMMHHIILAPSAK